MSAVVVSMATLFVYIYQARIMQSQQYSSVWPYIEWTMTISSDDIYLSVVNKGVGPAKIGKTSMAFDEEEVTDIRAMLRKVIHDRFDSLDVFGSVVENRVMAPGEEIRLFQIHGERLDEIEDIMSLFSRVQYTICFCSIYDECWTSHGVNVVEGCTGLN